MDNRQSGLTLIELLVVIAILAVLFGLSALGVRGLVERARAVSRSAEYDIVQTAIDIYNVGDGDLTIAPVSEASDPYESAGNTFGQFLRSPTHYRYLWDTGGESLRLEGAASADPDLVGWWRMNEDDGDTTLDDSGHGNDGTLHGAAWTAGVNGAALRFDGHNDRVVIPDSDSLDITDALSIEAWVLRTAGLGSWQGLIGKFGFHDNQRAYQLMINSGGQFSFHLSRDGRSGWGSHEFILTSGSYTVPPGVWVHVVATYDGETMRLYADGAEVGSKAYSDGIFSSSADLSFGATNNGNSQRFGGTLDEIRIYRRALSPGEVSQHYQAGGETPKSLTLLSPNGGEMVYPGAIHLIRWDSTGSVGSVRLEYSKDNFASDEHTIAVSTPNDGVHVWDVPDDDSGTVWVRVSDVSDAEVNDLSNAAFAISSSPAEPVARWPMDESSGDIVPDATDHGHDGARSDDTAWVTGHANNALSFASGDTWVQIPDHDDLDLQDTMTLEAWVYPTASGGWSTIIAKFTFGWLTNERAYQLMLNSGGGISQWTHVAATYDGTTMRIYVNGAEVGSRSYSDGIAATTASLMLGENSEGNSGQNFRGIIDEAAVYDVALSAITILDHAAGP